MSSPDHEKNTHSLYGNISRLVNRLPLQARAGRLRQLADARTAQEQNGFFLAECFVLSEPSQEGLVYQAVGLAQHAAKQAVMRGRLQPGREGRRKEGFACVYKQG